MAPFIDAHAHIGLLPGVVNDRYTPEDLDYIARQEGPQVLLISSATATTVSQRAGTLETVAMVEQFGERLKGMLWINPNDPSWREDVPLAIAHGFWGIKIHPVLDHYAVERAALDEVFSLAQRQGWPVLTHTGPDATPASALRYEPLIRAYPDVRLILAHMPLESILLAKRYENVYVDTTHVNPSLVALALHVTGPGKILFGTDAPAGFDVGHAVTRERVRRSYAQIIADLRAQEIPEAALAKILYANALAVFGPA